MTTDPPPEAILFMKVGFHVSETLSAILVRKAQEERDAGVTFWGYGGTLCHPKWVGPFARQCEAQGRHGQVVMAETTHPFVQSDQRDRTEYSPDGARWLPIPTGIRVPNSRYALVLRGLSPGAFDLDLASYVVAAGPSKDRPLSGYIAGQRDKAIAVRSEASPARPVKLVRITRVAELVEPYAVLLH